MIWGECFVKKENSIIPNTQGTYINALIVIILQIAIRSLKFMGKSSR